MRDIIINLQGYLWYGLRKWYWLLAGILLGAGYGYWSARQSVSYFQAKTTFVVNKKAGGSGIGTVLGRFGFAEGGGGEQNPNRIMGFAFSQGLINDMLLDSLTLRGERDLAINHVIAAFGLDAEGQLVAAYGTNRLSADAIADLSIPERSLLKRVYNFLVMDPARPLDKRNDVVTNMLSLVANTPDEDLTLLLTDMHYRALENFYTEESNGQSRATVRKLQGKADSLYAVLAQADYQLATYADTQLGLQSRRDLLRFSQLERKIQLLSVAYAEIIRNLETAKFSVSNSTPYFQLVNVPFKPLRRIRRNPVEEAGYGAAGGAIVAFLLLSLIRFYREVMRKPTEEAIA